MLKDPNIDIAMPWFVFQDTPLEEDIVQKLGRLTRGTTSRSWLVGWAGRAQSKGGGGGGGGGGEKIGKGHRSGRGSILLSVGRRLDRRGAEPGSL